MTLRRYTPSQLVSAHNELRRRLTAVEFFGPKFQKERERYCAGHFSLGYSTAIAPAEVELEEPDPQNHIDFWLVTPTGRHAFQITERQEPGRRRGDEFKAGPVPSPTEESLISAVELGPDWIMESVLKKEREIAGSKASLHLLVYVNFPAFELRFIDVVARLQTTKTSFASIWLLTGDSMSCPKPSPLLGELDGWYTTPARTVEA